MTTLPQSWKSKIGTSNTSFLLCEKRLWLYTYTVYTWNRNDPCFDWKRPCFGGLTFKNRGHLGSRYLDIFLSFACLFDFRVDPNAWNSWFPFTTVPSVFPRLLMRAGTGLVVGVKLGSCNSYSGIQDDILRYTPEIQHGTCLEVQDT